MKRNVILAFLGIQIVLGACKTEVIYEPGWVGKWEIYQVDSAQEVWYLDTTHYYDVFYEQGYIQFFDDSTGYLEINTSNRFDCMDSSFSWSDYQGMSDTIILSYPDGTGVFAYGLDMRAEELTFSLPTCQAPAGVGGQGCFYKVYSRRAK